MEVGTVDIAVPSRRSGRVAGGGGVSNQNSSNVNN
jgi:hypothetical protein